MSCDLHEEKIAWINISLSEKTAVSCSRPIAFYNYFQMPQRDPSRSRDTPPRRHCEKLTQEMHMILMARYDQYLEDIRKMTRMIKVLSDMREELYERARTM